MKHRRPSAGDVSHEGLLKPKRRGISRVCVKASPAFGRRRFHTNTDYIVFALVCCCSLIKIVFGMKLVLDEIYTFGMKVVLDELVFYRQGSMFGFIGEKASSTRSATSFLLSPSKLRVVTAGGLWVAIPILWRIRSLALETITLPLSVAVKITLHDTYKTEGLDLQGPRPTESITWSGESSVSNIADAADRHMQSLRFPFEPDKKSSKAPPLPLPPISVLHLQTCLFTISQNRTSPRSSSSSTTRRMYDGGRRSTISSRSKPPPRPKSPKDCVIITFKMPNKENA